MSKKINWFLINENYGANLCPYAFYFDADYHGFKKVYGRGMHYQGVGTENGFLRQIYDLDDYNSFAEWIFNKLSNDKKFARQMLKNIYRVVGLFYKFNKKIISKDLSTLTDSQLATVFKKFYDYFFAMSTWSVPFAFSEYGTPLWTNYLTGFLNTKEIPDDYTTLEIYQILTTHQRQTYTALEKENILHLAIIVENSPRLKRIFNLPVERIMQQLVQWDKKFLNKIEKHAKDFGWINFGFEGPLLEAEYFVGVIKDWVRRKKPAQEFEKNNQDLKILDKKRNHLIKDLLIDDKHRWMFWVVKEFSFQKAYRKDIEYLSYYAYDLLLKEFGQRFNISAKQGHYLLIPEIIDVLKKVKKVKINDINKRIQCNFYLVINGQAKLLIGDQAKKLIKKIKSRPIPKGLSELNGQCACKGKVQGTAKIIKDKKDYNKFNAGDVLVSWATNPNMVPLMKRASAIVTDEGGVTCHAAIVSRELGIPCVIGTRFATKILKDGQLVEVDATRGTVKIKKLIN